MRKYDWAFFDFDGTLANSGPGIIRCVRYALSCFGIEEQNMDILRTFIGPPLEESFMRHYGFTDQQAALAVEHYRSEYVDKGIYETTLYDGVVEMLRSLHDAGVVCAVASNKPTEMITLLMKHFGTEHYIAFVSGLSDGVQTKTQAIQHLLASLGKTDSSRCLMIGDRSYDAEGAKNTNMDFAAALYGFGTKEEFEPYPSVFFANTPQEIAGFVLE